MSVILIITHAKDACADLVTPHLEKSNADFVRFNTEEFQKIVKFRVDLNSSGQLNSYYRFPDRLLNLSDIGVVWNRRPHKPELGSELDYEPALKEWSEEETWWGLNASFTLLKAPIINPWEVNERLKFNKWIEMERAASLGFEIPISCMTNEPDSIKDFWETINHQMIFKKIRQGLFFMKDGKRFVLHTSAVPEDKMTDEFIKRMRFCPVFLQENIKKKYDIRAIVIGDKVLSFAIHSQNIKEGITDYRTAALMGKIDQMKHECIDLGKDTNNKLVAFVKSFGLSFSAIDLIETPDGRLIFLEDNPNGQWAWLEQKTGVQISKTFAEFFVRKMELDNN